MGSVYERHMEVIRRIKELTVCGNMVWTCDVPLKQYESSYGNCEFTIIVSDREYGGDVHGYDLIVRLDDETAIINGSAEGIISELFFEICNTQKMSIAMTTKVATILWEK